MSYAPGQNVNPQAGGTDFPGTGTNVGAIFGLPSDLAVVPVLLKRAVGTEPTALDVQGAEAYTPADLKTAVELSASISQKDPNWVANMQDQLLAGGFYTTKRPDITRGVVDDDTQAAWNHLIARTARGAQSKTLDEVLSEALTARGGVKPGMAGAAGGAGAAVSSPLDIRDAAQQVAKKTLGRGFSDAELARFVASFQGMQSTEAAGGGAAPSVAAAAEQQARTAAPAEAGAHDLASVYDMFTSLLGGH